ncbi:MAG: ribosome recycling factor [Nitrospirae bacterium GWC2_46_6]|nr:MAG: ribosome recycling factor [Nitrospirae bacterium GWC2_46_6]OGW20743.1 MAG: ribosome recycling factor [Nitrospirae bacterium GWA2_46_11]OGW22699.1 MAG: ribosome recycling factor [Nitrospirae bacterium GWB2_47_37]HAK87921.1 ribosome recycling factor [Nitrospiraceae bacterium]HCL81425.1 ribosome recycling factor [Nitrospiraceae bacterium]
MQEFKKKASDRMNAAVDVLKKDFASLRTGRASLALLDGISVDYYGTQTPVNQVATLGIPDPRQITVQPWEQKIIPEIEKAILKSGLGLTPSNDGKTIRLNIPALTEERRKELVKVAKKRAEEARVAVRNIRRDINEDVKKAEKDQHLSEDDVKKLHEEIQKITDSYIAKVEEVLQHKEKEIMEV